MVIEADSGITPAPLKETRSFPKPDDLKRLRQQRRTYFAGKSVETCKICVTLKVVTPILGGSYKLRHIDDIDIIRPQSIRPYLRFWWRALYAHNFTSAEELYKAERALWGGAADKDAGGGRSPVEVQVSILEEGKRDDRPVELYGRNETPGAYALWPAKDQKEDRHRKRPYVPTAPRRAPGTQFELKLLGPKDKEAILRNVLRAWIIFGGYGGRTRRGLGGLSVVGNLGEWLPKSATLEEFAALFRENIFAEPEKTRTQTPSLRKASLYVGRAGSNPESAWTTALGWLREFRQGAPDNAGAPPDKYARRFGRTRTRPSVSNWPEADKIRHFSTAATRWAHTPRYSAETAWPRSGFGLPIVGQFQGTSQEQKGTRFDRRKNRDVPVFFCWDELPPTHVNYGEEPGNFELRWRSGPDEHERLASPLIVKPLALADGRFVPCALWFSRELSADAYLGLAEDAIVGGQRIRRVKRSTEAPFERAGTTFPLLAPGDTPLFASLKKATLRDAFLGWLALKAGVVRVAP